MIEDYLRERKVRRTLRGIARQRVAIVLQPENVQVIERSPPREEWFELGVRTCLIRGWVEILYENLPTGQVTFRGNTPNISDRIYPETHYKLTEAGWAVLNRSHAWLVATFLVSSVSFVTSALALVVAWLSMPKV